MDPLKVDLWPFDPRQAGELRRWWEQCYLPGEAEPALLDQPYWSMLFGERGTGKSTTLSFVLNQFGDESLIIRYGPEQWKQWPETTDMPEAVHLARMMGLAAAELLTWVKAHPERLKALYTTQKQFLYWFLEKFSGERAYIRLIDGLEPEIEAIMRPVEYKAMYSDQTAQNLNGQIEEFLILCRRLGKKQVMVAIDIHEPLTAPQRGRLRELMQWLDLKQHDGLRGIIAFSDLALPDQDFDAVKKYWKDLGRDRIEVVPLVISAERSFEIVSRHISAATGGAVHRLQDLLTSEQYACLKSMLDKAFPGSPPGPWLILAKAVLAEAAKTGYPLAAGAFNNLRKAFYCEHVKLYFDPQRDHEGVWRGSEYIALDPGTFKLLSKLVDKRAEPVNYSTMKQEKGNMHTLVHRLRERIEPEGIDEHIYVLTQKTYGYWLEHCVELSGSKKLL